jgi:molybdopterin converting factor small subunit
MQTTVHFYSYFSDLTGCSQVVETLPAESTIEDLLNQLCSRFPKLAGMRRSMLIAVGVEYASQDHQLREGEQVSLFPPVQGG